MPLRVLSLTTFQARWVSQQKSCLPSDSVRSGVLRCRSESPYGFSGPIGSISVSVAYTVFSVPSTSRSSLATRKCWW
ncbi:Uncharacterised protein [Mycobacteroides abscessus subsp. abscessus]|nr:Uncharacterised protein [Mycobacteroides abscessus subsp. abscessus]SIN59277.1 Uncharacterised protein [Mycobacteroides abscessus subsp. abscessus]